MAEQKKILIIEDDQYIRELYADLLTEEGISVTQAIDGQEGLMKLRHAKFDLVLLDIMMPNLGGIDVLKALKKVYSAKLPFPIIVLTNLSHDKVIKEAEELGARGYLTKSELTPDVFIQKVKQLLK